MAMPPLRDLANKLIFQVHLATIAAHIANFQEFPLVSSQAWLPAELANAVLHFPGSQSALVKQTPPALVPVHSEQ